LPQYVGQDAAIPLAEDHFGVVSSSGAAAKPGS
jgi:hypothetical protein